MPSVVRREFDHAPWKSSLAEITFQQFDPTGVATWSLLRGLHPFSVTVEPDPVAGFVGTIQLVTSNNPFAPPVTGTAFAALGDPIVIDTTDPTAAHGVSTITDAPFQWIGVVPTTLTAGLVRVYVFASPYSRNIQP